MKLSVSTLLSGALPHGHSAMARADDGDASDGSEGSSMVATASTAWQRGTSGQSEAGSGSGARSEVRAKWGEAEGSACFFYSASRFAKCVHLLASLVGRFWDSNVHSLLDVCDFILLSCPFFLQGLETEAWFG